MKRKKRTYNTRLIKCELSYTVQEIAERLSVHVNAVHRWTKVGLSCIDGLKPQMVHGSELIAFLKLRQSKRKYTCKETELYCCKCRKPQPAWEGQADLIIRNRKQLNIHALCAVCTTPMNKVGSIKKLEEYAKTFSVQTIQGEHLIEREYPPVKCEIEGANEA